MNNDVSIPVWEKDEKGMNYVALNGIRWYPDFHGYGVCAVFDWKSPDDILAANADRAKVALFIREHPAPVPATA